MILFCIIDKTASGTDQDIHAAFQHFQLLIVAIAAVSANLQAGRLRQRFSVCVDLYRQFSRRSHDKRARLVNFAVCNRWMRK